MLKTFQRSFADVDPAFPRLTESEIFLDTDSPLLVRRLIYGEEMRPSCNVDSPSWLEIETVLRGLDGRGEAVIEMREEYRYLIVSGTEDKYLVAAQLWGDSRFLCNPALRDRAEFTAVWPDQWIAKYSGDLGVETERMLRATWYFARFGTLHPVLRWVRDCVHLSY